MTIAIVLRTNGARNVFRDAIVSTLGSKLIDSAVLCSGFFQENFKGSAYQVSTEKSLSTVCAASGVSLVTVGIHNSTWLPAYKEFQNNMRAARVNVRCLYKRGLRWHAKVFIGSSGGVPNIGIIGSSNMTRNAFSSGPRFNNECDVFMWDRNSPIATLAAGIADSIGEQIMIRAPYLPRMNGGLGLSETLRRIEVEVLEGDLQEL